MSAAYQRILKRRQKKLERARRIKRRIFGVVAFIGVMGIIGTVGASDANLLSDSQLLFQFGVFGLITTIGIKFSDVMKYRYDIETGEEWFEYND